MRAIRELAGPHAGEQVEVLGHAARAMRAVLARLGQRAAIGAHLLRALAVDIGVAALDQRQGAAVHGIEVVRGVVEVRAPVEAQPPHHVDDRIDVLLFLARRVGIVEAHMAGAPELPRDAEVQADRLGVPDVQEAVGLRRKARADPRRVDRTGGVPGGFPWLARPAPRGIPACCKVCLDDVTDEVARRLCGSGIFGGHEPGSLPDRFRGSPGALGLSLIRLPAALQRSGPLAAVKRVVKPARRGSAADTVKRSTGVDLDVRKMAQQEGCRQARVPSGDDRPHRRDQPRPGRDRVLTRRHHPVGQREFPEDPGVLARGDQRPPPQHVRRAWLSGLRRIQAVVGEPGARRIQCGALPAPGQGRPARVDPGQLQPHLRCGRAGRSGS